MQVIYSLGEARAERDHVMLDKAFYESQNYRVLFENQDRFIVVGRRGTGKSALVYRLSKDWKDRKFFTFIIAPAEEEVIGLRPVAELFGNSVSRIRAGIKLAWRYALFLELALYCKNSYKTANEVEKHVTLFEHLEKWKKRGDNSFVRMRSMLRESLLGIDNPDDRIAEISSILQINTIEKETLVLIESLNHGLVVFIDKLDEGYEPDNVGIGIVDGIIYGTDEVRYAIGEKLKTLVFLRDNIFRAIQSADPDFSRNLEGQILRLHWDSEELFYMACKRIRATFSLNQESDIKTWNAITENELHGREGFKKCLRLTLYRPRDVIALLNTAVIHAKNNYRKILINDDFEASSKQISIIRFDDLNKEYSSVFPGIDILTKAFSHGTASFFVSNAIKTIKSVIENPEIDAAALQHLTILGSEIEILKSLYGVGFFGVFDQQSNTWIYSHDGRQSDRAITENDSLMIHPCYWSALNLQREGIEQNVAEQIYDEYEITIDSLSTKERARKIGQIISEYPNIPTGAESALLFEEWCKRIIEIAFAKELINIQLHPNNSAVQRRDIVATNQGTRGFWKRILNDYQTRQVIFEVKNFEEIGIEEYRQMNGYLTREYGKLGFIICRDKQPGLIKGRELEAFKEFYIQGKLIIKINAPTLISILSKLRSPSKIDAGDLALSNQLDEHIRLYSTGQNKKTPKKKSSKKNISVQQSH